MTDFSRNVLKALAANLGTSLGDLKYYEVQGEDFMIFTGRVVILITDYAPNHPSGLFSFDGQEVQGQMFSPWVQTRHNELPHSFTLPVEQIVMLHKPFKAWMTLRPKREEYDGHQIVPYAQLSVQALDQFTCSLSFTAGGVDEMTEFSMENLQGRVAGLVGADYVLPDHVFPYNGVEFENALRLFARLKNPTEDVLVRYSTDSSVPVWLSIEHLGRELHVGLPFEAQAYRANMPNAETAAVLRDSDRGIGIVDSGTAEQMFDRLGIGPAIDPKQENLQA